MKSPQVSNDNPWEKIHVHMGSTRRYPTIEIIVLVCTQLYLVVLVNSNVNFYAVRHILRHDPTSYSGVFFLAWSIFKLKANIRARIFSVR